jgi:hypothetical protein
VVGFCGLDNECSEHLRIFKFLLYVKFKELWFDSWKEQEIFLFCRVSRSALGPTCFPLQWVVRVLSPEVEQPKCEAGWSPLIIGET